MYNKIEKDLKTFGDEKFAKWFMPFIHFENTPNDKILGIRVPILRKLAKKYKNVETKTLIKLLQSNTREYRQLALFIMLSKENKEEMCNIYLENIEHINNWDLVDCSAHKILAPYVSKDVLINLSNSKYMWANRIAIVATWYYIKQNDFDLTFKFAAQNFKHPHYLMHKATGWMLREIGKQNEQALVNFLKQHSQNMPAIMLSYATERLKSTKKDLRF